MKNRRYGLLGKNIDYSFSRGYFTEKFKSEALTHTYENFDIPSISEFSSVLKEERLAGLNVTIPYKLEVISFLDRLDQSAETIGAVNVIKFERDGSLTGYNSDYYGFQKSLEPLLNDSVERALILGTGGASKAVAFALDQLGIGYQFVSRTSNTKKNAISYDALDKEVIENHSLIVNSTPLGTFPNVKNAPSIPYQYLSRKHILYDLIYNPAQTTFMKKGLERGATASNGLEMLQLQAEKAWQIWNS